MDAKRFLGPHIAAFVPLTLLALNSGCVGLLAHIGYLSGGATVPAEFEGLEGKRVAVICVSESMSFGSGTDTLELAQQVGSILGREVEHIEIVRPDEVADWVDRNDWDGLDYVEVGRGVKAEMVVAVEMSGFRLYEGKTLYKGRANLTVSVLDLADGGKDVFRKKLPELTFPTNGAYPATDASESKFRRHFIRVLAEHVARYFHDCEVMDKYGRDPPNIG